MKNFRKNGISICSMLIIPLLFLTSCNQKTQNKDSTYEMSGVISISGAFALYPMTVKWADEFRKIHPEVRIDISAGGAGKGMADALAGMVDLAMFSRSVTPEEISKGAWFIALTRDAVLPTVNSDNPDLQKMLENGITKKQFEKMYLSDKPIKWSDLIEGASNGNINIFTRSDACGAAEMWGLFLGKNQESLKGVGVFGDPGMADAIKKDIKSTGYNNVNYVYDFNTRKPYPGLSVIPIDLNENGMIDPEENFYSTLDDIMKAIKDGKYPSPPARDLYFVSKGKPQSIIVVEFIKWILTEGQKYVSEAGYVQLTERKINTELEKLN